MNNLIDTYLDELKNEMKGFDPAVIRDALADAEEHFQTALAIENEEDPDLDENAALQKIIDQYGSPAETATAYAEVERRTPPGLVRPPQAKAQKSLLSRFFGIYADPRAWGGLLYMLISLVTGIIYFTWAVTGTALSISLSIFIFGLPLALVFLISVRGIALLEGRLVEALLGVRMPRRPLFAAREGKLVDRIKTLLRDKHTWLALLYQVLQMVLGVLYFTVLVTLLAVAFSGIFIVIMQYIFGQPVMFIGQSVYYLPAGYLVLLFVGGFLMLTLVMHLARWIGRLHGKYAKALLVAE